MPFTQVIVVIHSVVSICVPMDCSTPGLPVLHHLPELAQTLVWWCHPTSLSSVIPFSSCLQSFPASGSFLMSWLFASSGQSIEASASVIPMTAAAAKSLQSCPTLCDPIDGSPLGSSVPGIFQARILEWVAISFSNAWKWKVKAKSLSRVLLLATPWTAAYQAPPSMGFSRQKYWSGVPLPSPMTIQGLFPLGLIGLIFLPSKGLSSLLQHQKVWRHQFFSSQPSLWSNSHICTWLLGKP